MTAGKSARRHLRVGTAMSNGVRMTPPLPPSGSRLAGQESGTDVKYRLRPGETSTPDLGAARVSSSLGPGGIAMDRRPGAARSENPRAARRQPTHPRCNVLDQAYFAASTNSLVQVFVRSIVLPWTFLLYVWSTLKMKSGAPAGIFPSGLNIGMLPVSAVRYRSSSPA